MAIRCPYNSSSPKKSWKGDEGAALCKNIAYSKNIDPNVNVCIAQFAIIDNHFILVQLLRPDS